MSSYAWRAGSSADTADSLVVSADLFVPPRNRFNCPNNEPTAPAHCRTSSSRTARRSGLVLAFVAPSKTSGSPPHKRRLIAWETRRNPPDRPCPNRLVSSTRRAKRSAWDFVGFVIVISKKSLNRSGAGAVYLTVWRIELPCAPSGSTAGEGAQRPLANSLRAFKTSPVLSEFTAS